LPVQAAGFSGNFCDKEGLAPKIAQGKIHAP
jgi:hypothetical protein